MLEDLIRYIAQSLVEHPQQVEVTTVETANAITIELRVAQSDMGKVIGKQGRIAKAIRSVLKAAAMHQKKKVMLDII